MVFEAFRRMREECPQRAAFLVTTGDRAIPITWRQFTDDIAVIVRIIQSYAPGGVIGLLGENSYEWMVAHAAVLFSGATAVPIDVNLDAADISRRLKSVDASALIHSALYGDKAREVGRLTPGLVVGGFGTRKTDLFLEAARAAMRFGVDSVWDVGAKTADTAMIMFTSGTTSEPRGAELALAGVEAFCEGTAKALPMKLGDRSLMLLPLHHIFGICTAYLMLSKGVALGICPDFRRIYDAVERFRVNFLFLVPALAEILAQKIAHKGRSAEEALGHVPGALDHEDVRRGGPRAAARVDTCRRGSAAAQGLREPRRPRHKGRHGLRAHRDMRDVFDDAARRRPARRRAGACLAGGRRRD